MYQVATLLKPRLDHCLPPMKCYTMLRLGSGTIAVENRCYWASYDVESDTTRALIAKSGCDVTQTLSCALICVKIVGNAVLDGLAWVNGRCNRRIVANYREARRRWRRMLVSQNIVISTSCGIEFSAVCCLGAEMPEKVDIRVWRVLPLITVSSQSPPLNLCPALTR